MPSNISGPAANALASLTPEQVVFLRSLPKAELHAHLNGCIPLAALQELANRYVATEIGNKNNENSYSDQREVNVTRVNADVIKEGVEKLRGGVELNAIQDFFGLFTTIHALTSTRESLAFATRAVLEDFLGPLNDCITASSSSSSSFFSNAEKQCAYLELRSTPRSMPHLTRMQYVITILDEIERYPPSSAAYILALDRRMAQDVAEECIEIAIELRRNGRRVIGVDLCGDPMAGDVKAFAHCFARAKEAGLGITLHIAETEANSPTETLHLLSMRPDRLGHATFLDSNAAKKVVLERGIAIEICLSSNLLCKTVPSLQDHHLNYHFSLNHPVVICTDDTLPFRTSLLAEYALLLAAPPLGLGLSEQDVEVIAKMGMESRFGKKVGEGARSDSG